MAIGPDSAGNRRRSCGYAPKARRRYETPILDLINMEKSDCYNPFRYINSENDVQRLVTNLFKSTTPKGSSTQDPFWDNAASMLMNRKASVTVTGVPVCLPLPGKI